MGKVRTPREAWIAAATQALADGGPAAVHVEVLAASLGVSKGGFYWHFANRDALLDEVLGAWETAMVDDVIIQVSADTDDPRAIIRHLFEPRRPRTSPLSWPFESGRDVIEAWPGACRESTAAGWVGCARSSAS